MINSILNLLVPIFDNMDPKAQDRKSQNKPRKKDKEVEKVRRWGHTPKAQKVSEHGPSKGPKRENAHKGQGIEHISPPQDIGHMGESTTEGWPSLRNKNGP